MWTSDAQTFDSILRALNVNPMDGAALEIGGAPIVSLDGGNGPNPMLELMPQIRFFDLGFLGGLRGCDILGDFLDPQLVFPLAECFQFVYSFDTLEHITNPFDFACHMAMVTKPGGWLFLSSVFAFPYHPSPEDYWRFSPKGLKRLFHELPVNVIWYGWSSAKPDGVMLFAQKRPSSYAPRHYRHSDDFIASLTGEYS